MLTPLLFYLVGGLARCPVNAAYAIQGIVHDHRSVALKGGLEQPMKHELGIVLV